MTVECVSTSELAPALLREAEDFLDSQDTGHPFQYPQWAGPRSRVMLIREHGRIWWLGTFGVQRPLGRRFPWMRALVGNRGPVCDDSHFWAKAAEELADNLRDEKFTYVGVLPEWLCQADEDHPSFGNHPKWRCVGNHRASLRLDLNQGDDDIFANFRKISRYEVRRAERLGTTVHTASTDTEIEEFLSVYQRMAIRKGFRPDPIDNLRRNIHWLVGSESRGALLMASAGGTLYGGAVIARSGRRCWYIWGATDREENLATGHILQWRALLWAKSHGCTEYDFGGCTPGATSGPAWFKEGFGGTVVHLVCAHRRVLDPKRYNFLRAISKVSSWV
jgi:GNAT acetyltransferase-like protein